MESNQFEIKRVFFHAGTGQEAEYICFRPESDGYAPKMIRNIALTAAVKYLYSMQPCDRK